MKDSNTQNRLKKIMEMRNLRQIDILNLVLPYCQEYGVKMHRSDISQYLSGKSEPNQDKLFVLGLALNVSEAWLMGYDVPMKRQTTESATSHTVTENDLKVALFGSLDEVTDEMWEEVKSFAEFVKNKNKKLGSTTRS